MYECGECKKEINAMDMNSLPGIKCPQCGYRILYKIRPPVVKKIKAR
ncbi:MAG: DNA-directed RNA polymerase subunit P [Candidatus Helarchaeota archaeon]